MSPARSPDSIALVLASRSPRRAQLLRGAGFEPIQVTPYFQDPADPNEAFARTPNGPDAALHLAERKAESLPPELFTRYPDAVFLTSDTVGIAPDGQLVGTPESSDQALAMLRGLVGRRHVIATGVCLHQSDGTFESFVATAAVDLGPVDEDELQRYVASGQWAGKAGGYNLIERQTAGWPITVEGDPATVMGLPMDRLTPLLEQLGVPRIATHA
ncbi:MAG: Maf family protein [Planctomycetota bacterium]